MLVSYLLPAVSLLGGQSHMSFSLVGHTKS